MTRASDGSLSTRFVFCVFPADNIFGVSFNTRVSRATRPEDDLFTAVGTWVP